MAVGRFIEGRGNHLALHAALHVGDFFRALIDKQHQQEDLRMIVRNSLGDTLQKHRLTGTRRGDDQGTLRSEEHTSELQSLMRITYAVFCLKKKITTE